MVSKELQQQPSIPKPVKKVLVKIAVLFGAWLLLYPAWLKPLGIPDTQLTQVVTAGTHWMLSFFYEDVQAIDSSIYLNGKKVVNIGTQCNGLELLALYLGILACIPGSWKRWTVFAITGITAITILNMVRCALLAWMYYHKMSLADFAHHYAFKLIIYAFAFLGWYLYSRKTERHVKATT